MMIMNLHGFMGEADNKNYKALCGMFPAEEIISPKLDYMGISPEEMLDRLSAVINTEDEVIFVGQSLGGWFADKLSRKFSRPCILTNPCNYPHQLGLIETSGIPQAFLEQYRRLSSDDKNERAYVLCSDADSIIPDNHADCLKIFDKVKTVHGSHSTIENLSEHISDMLTEIKKDRLLLFLGRGSAFSDEHNSAFFTEDNDLILIDCPASSFQKVKKMNWEQYRDIFILITHTHGDHAGGAGMMLQYVWFASGMKKKVTIVAPSEEVREDMLLLLMRIEGCEKEWFNIITAGELHKKWFTAAVPTVHVEPLKGRCFGYHLNIHGSNVVYTGDTSSLDAFVPLLGEGSVLYTEAAFYKSKAHLHLEQMLPEFIRLTERGVRVCLMHLDNEEEIRKMTDGTPLRLAALY